MRQKTHLYVNTQWLISIRIRAFEGGRSLANEWMNVDDDEATADKSSTVTINHSHIRQFIDYTNNASYYYVTLTSFLSIIWAITGTNFTLTRLDSADMNTFRPFSSVVTATHSSGPRSAASAIVARTAFDYVSCQTTFTRRLTSYSVGYEKILQLKSESNSANRHTQHTQHIIIFLSRSDFYFR